MVGIHWLFRGWVAGQLLSAAFFSLNHGANDAQKTMGIVAGILFTAGYIKTFYIPFWVVLMAHAAISLGTLAGGWRIIHTMGSKITKLQPVGGFAAETGAALALLTATHFGVPVSTTHAITGAIVGVGSTRRSLRGPVGRGRTDCLGLGAHDPAAFLIAAATYSLLRWFGAR